MAREFGKRRAEIMSFLNGLSDREKLVVLTYLCNDARISARIPDLPRTILDMHHAFHGMELLKFADTERSNVDLEFLARRKGCRLERIEGAGDRGCAGTVGCKRAAPGRGQWNASRRTHLDRIPRPFGSIAIICCQPQKPSDQFAR